MAANNALVSCIYKLCDLIEKPNRLNIEEHIAREKKPKMRFDISQPLGTIELMTIHKYMVNSMKTKMKCLGIPFILNPPQSLSRHYVELPDVNRSLATKLNANNAANEKKPIVKQCLKNSNAVLKIPPKTIFRIDIKKAVKLGLVTVINANKSGSRKKPIPQNIIPLHDNSESKKIIQYIKLDKSICDTINNLQSGESTIIFDDGNNNSITIPNNNSITIPNVEPLGKLSTIETLEDDDENPPSLDIMLSNPFHECDIALSSPSSISEILEMCQLPNNGFDDDLLQMIVSDLYKPRVLFPEEEEIDKQMELDKKNYYRRAQATNIMASQANPYAVQIENMALRCRNASPLVRNVALDVFQEYL